MTKNEFIQLIEDGRDIMFDLSGKHFTILTWLDDGIGIDEQYPNDTKMSVYSSAKELIENYKVNNVPIGELIADIEITDYS